MRCAGTRHCRVEGRSSLSPTAIPTTCWWSSASRSALSTRATRRARRPPRSSACATARSCSGTRRTCRPRGATARSSDGLLRFGLELVADAEARLDERVPRRRPVDLLAQPAHEHVDGPVAVRFAAPPHLLQQLVARHHAAAVERKRVEQPKLGRRQLGAAAVDERLHLAWVDAQLLDLDRLTALFLGRPNAATRGGADAGD